MHALSLAEFARWTTAAWEVHSAAFAPAALREAQVQLRLAELERTAAKRSPLYSELYQGQLGRGPVELASLPAVAKQRLMNRFDDWCTDRRLTGGTRSGIAHDAHHQSCEPRAAYDIGDRVTWLTERCFCGNPWPAIHVEGRTDDIRDFTNASGGMVSLCHWLSRQHWRNIPTCTVHLVQKDNSAIELRLEPRVARQKGSITACLAALTGLLRANGLGRVRMAWEERSPRRSASGKLRRIVATA